MVGWVVTSLPGAITTSSTDETEAQMIAEAISAVTQ